MADQGSRARARDAMVRPAAPFITMSLLPGSGVEPLVLETAVERGDIFAIAVEEKRRHPLVAAQDPLIGLAPARMRDGRVHIGPEAIFGGLDRLPEIVGLLVGQGEPHDALGGFEAVF